MFAREGYPFILGAAALAAIAFAVALRVRSWPLWLAALVLTVATLSVAWFFRNPTRVGERAANVSIKSADKRVMQRSTSVQYVNPTSGRFLNVASKTVIASLLAT